jgi:cation transport protein ChaC
MPSASRPTIQQIVYEDVLFIRDPRPMLDRLRSGLDPRDELWVFGYASLIWRPEFEPAERRQALVRGWHRCLRMRSRVNRGTLGEPGLVFALMPGGACRGIVYRLRRDRVDAELERLWAREMPTGVYDPRFLACRTPEGTVPALAFTLARRSEAYVGRLGDEQLLHVLRHARGRFGTTLDYLAQTAHALRAHGVRDREVERTMRLAARHGLLPDSRTQPTLARAASRSSTVSTSTSTPGSSTSAAKAG